MKQNRVRLIAASIAIALCAGPLWADSPRPQASPEQIEAIENWTYSLALQAATYGAPLVAMYN